MSHAMLLWGSWITISLIDCFDPHSVLLFIGEPLFLVDFLSYILSFYTITW